MSRLSKNQMTVSEYTERSFDGTYKASTQSDLVMTTLAYDNGWNVYVDGKRVEPIKVFGTFLAFRVDGDLGQTHEIEMFYMPRTIVIGALISFASLLLFIALIVVDKRRGLGCRDNRPTPVLLQEGAEEAEKNPDQNAPTDPAPPKKADGTATDKKE